MRIAIICLYCFVFFFSFNILYQWVQPFDQSAHCHRGSKVAILSDDEPPMCRTDGALIRRHCPLPAEHSSIPGRCTFWLWRRVGCLWRRDSGSIETISLKGKQDALQTDLFGSNQRRSLLIPACTNGNGLRPSLLPFLHWHLLNPCSLKVIPFQEHNSSVLSHVF